MNEKETSPENNEEYSEEEINSLLKNMGGNVPLQEDKYSLYSFLNQIIQHEDSTKIGNLVDDEGYDELGMPQHSVRGCLEMARISEEIMGNKLFTDYFKSKAEETLSTSLSRKGFLIRQGSTTTKQVADVTKRRKINKGWFGKKNVEETGGDGLSN